MILRFLCPSGHVLDVDARLAGRKIRCGGCGKIMIVPGPAKNQPANPFAKPLAKPPTAAGPASNATPASAVPQKPPPVPKPQTAQKPPAPQEPPAPQKPQAPQAQPQAKKPTAELPPPISTDLPREPGMVPLPLPTAFDTEEISPPQDVALASSNGRGHTILSWFRRRWPSAHRHLPPDVTVPGKAERRIAVRLAAVLSATALLSLLPVVVMGHINLIHAPPWALATAFLGALQIVYAAWIINAPDWATARVQMAVCAISTTIYGMFMTLTLITPPQRPLILGLNEAARRAAPAWCGLMLILMAVATWYCGRTSVRWKRSLRQRNEE